MTAPDPTASRLPGPARTRPGWTGYAGTTAVVAGCTVIAELMQRRFDLSNLTMVYLVAVVVSAIAFGRGPAMFAALLSVAVFGQFPDAWVWLGAAIIAGSGIFILLYEHRQRKRKT